MKTNTNTETKFTATDTHPNERKLIEVYRWSSCLAAAFKRGHYRNEWVATPDASNGRGEFLGYAVSGHGKHSAHLQSEVRETLEQAARDMCDPGLKFQITGYSCG